MRSLLDFKLSSISYRIWGCFQTTQALKDGNQINLRQEIKDVHPSAQIN